MTGFKHLRLFCFVNSISFLFLLASPQSHAQSSSDKNLEEKLFSSGEGGEENLEESAPPAPLRSSDEELTEIKEDDSATAETREVEAEDSKKLEEAIKGPRQVPFEHILVVQNRYVRKEGRHEVTPILAGIQPGDSFRRQLQWGFSYTYHFNEDWGVEAIHASFVTNMKSGLSDSIRGQTTLETYREEPVYSLGSAILWTPLHSKAATDSSIYRFEGYFILGGGMTKFEKTSAGLGMGGIGFRAYLSKRAIFKAEVRDYVDFINGTQQRLNLLIGASVLLGSDS